MLSILGYCCCKRCIACRNLPKARRVSKVTCSCDSRLTVSTLVMGLGATGLKCEQRFEFKNRLCECRYLPGLYLKPGHYLALSFHGRVTKLATCPWCHEKTHMWAQLRFCLMPHVSVWRVSLFSCQNISTQLLCVEFTLFSQGCVRAWTVFMIQSCI